MTTVIAIALDGLVYASWLFIVSLGLTLIYGVMRILNIAHGSFYALGAYSAAWLTGIYFHHGYAPYGSYAVLVLAGAVVGIGAGLAIERGVLRLMYGRDEVVMVLVTYAIFLMLEDAIKLVWGVDAYFAYQPYSLPGLVDVLGLPYNLYDLGFVGVAGACGAAAWWGLYRTHAGRQLTAVIHDREMSIAMGIDVARVYTVTFILGAALAALGGALTAPKISVAPGMGVDVIVLAFAVVVIGGLGSIAGAIVGALLVGFARAGAVHLLPQVELFAIYGVMAAVLAVWPHGLFAPEPPRKI